MINELLRQGQNKVWVHLRDPRQTVLSFIHHDVKFSKNEDGGIPNLYATTRELMFPPDQLANREVYGADLLNSIEKQMIVRNQALTFRLMWKTVYLK